MSRDNIPVFGVVERKDWCSSASRNPFIVLNAAGVNRSMHSRNKRKLERLYHSIYYTTAEPTMRCAHWTMLRPVRNCT